MNPNSSVNQRDARTDSSRSLQSSSFDPSPVHRSEAPSRLSSVPIVECDESDFANTLTTEGSHGLSFVRDFVNKIIRLEKNSAVVTNDFHFPCPVHAFQ